MKISIVTTIYNIESYIGKCIESLLAQTYKELEIILVDDCGTDKSMEVVSQYNDERIKVIHHPHNMGAGQARRTGIDAATGEYVITIDGDDWISPTFIEDLVNNAKKTDADIVSGGITIHLSEEYQEIKRFAPMVSTGMKKIKDYGDQKIIFLNNKIVRRKLYDLVPYSTRRFCEDTPVILPLLYYANAVSYVDNQGYFYRQHDASLCHKTNKEEQALFKALCCKDLLKFFSDKGDEYQWIINKNEYIGYLSVIANCNETFNEKYKSELGELAPSLLEMLFNRKEVKKENTVNSESDVLKQRLDIAIHEAGKYGFNNNGRDNLVHVIWLGGRRFSDTILKCMDSWKKYIGNRTLCLWTEKSLPMDHKWVKECYDLKKYAFATDYLRLWCIYFYGGVYIDVDVELLKPLDVDKNFFALESYTNSVALGLSFGAEPKNAIIAGLSSIYDNISPDIEDCYKQVQPNLVTDVFVNNGWVYRDEKHEFKGFTIYPTDVFCPKNMQTNELNVTENTKAIHHYLGSWR